MSDQLKRIEDIRNTVSVLDQKRQRLQGALETHQVALKQMREESQKRFGMPIEDLSGYLEDLQAKVNDNLEEMERILAGGEPSENHSQETCDDQSVEEPDHEEFDQEEE